MRTCQFCNSEFYDKSALNKHQQKTKYCLKIQQLTKENASKGLVVNINKKFECENCLKLLSTKQRLDTHLTTCKIKKEEEENKSELLIIKNEMKIDNNEINSVNEISHYPLFINDYSLLYRKEDGYIDVTNLCKAGNKEFKHWNSLEKTQPFLKVLSSEVGISTSLLIKSKKGKSSLFDQGTWAHPQVAINIAQWISPEFDVKVSKWIFELMITGKVELVKEKSNEDLEKVYKEQIKNLSSQLETSKLENQSLLVKHNSSLKTHRYIKFKETGSCFYIIEQGISCQCKNNIQRKFGIAGLGQDTFDDRLKSHRTIWPQLKVNFIIFMKEVDILESSIKRIYEKEINPNGHEIVEGVTTEQIIKSIIKIIDALCIVNYKIISNEKIDEYNKYVFTTIK